MGCKVYFSFTCIIFSHKCLLLQFSFTYLHKNACVFAETRQVQKACQNLMNGKEDFLRFLPYMGMSAMTTTVWKNVSPSHGDSIWNLASIGLVVSEQKMLKECGRWTDDGWTDGRWRPTCPISSPMSLQLRWAKNGVEQTISRFWITCIKFHHQSSYDLCEIGSGDLNEPTHEIMVLIT